MSRLPTLLCNFHQNWSYFAVLTIQCLYCCMGLLISGIVDKVDKGWPPDLGTNTLNSAPTVERGWGAWVSWQKTYLPSVKSWVWWYKLSMVVQEDQNFNSSLATHQIWGWYGLWDTYSQKRKKTFRLIFFFFFLNGAMNWAQSLVHASQWSIGKLHPIS